jgi:hypothetical protein
MLSFFVCAGNTIEPGTMPSISPVGMPRFSSTDSNNGNDANQFHSLLLRWHTRLDCAASASRLLHQLFDLTGANSFDSEPPQIGPLLSLPSLDESNAVASSLVAMATGKRGAQVLDDDNDHEMLDADGGPRGSTSSGLDTSQHC